MFIARQAIYDRALNVYGYELLFRSNNQSNIYDGVSSLQSSASVLSGLFESGINQLVDDKLAFINFDADLIQSDAIELIGANRLVIELLEDIIIDEKLISRLKLLQEKGHIIALDDFVEDYSSYPLVQYANIIKFDLIATPLGTICSEVNKALHNKKILLAEKIETEEEFKKAKKMGFHLFQGYFFNKPSLVDNSTSPYSMKSSYIQLLKEVKKQEVSFRSLASIIEKDVNLAYRLVRLSSIRAGKDLIYSIQYALSFMGLQEIERWVNIMMIRDMNSNDTPDELMRISLVRTKFSELIAINSSLTYLKNEASIMGLFSVLDAMLKIPMDDALKNIALHDTIKDALIYNRGELYPIYKLIISYEIGDWYSTEEIGKEICADNALIYRDYLTSIIYARDIMEVLT
jgi:c-di-GMP-related signal transduction protein